MSVFMGIDWSEDKHDVAFMNAAGVIIARLTFAHQPDGFGRLEATGQQLGVQAHQCIVFVLALPISALGSAIASCLLPETAP